MSSSSSKSKDGIEEGSTPLFLSVQMGNLEVASILLAAGSNVDVQLHSAQGREGITPLLAAIAKGDVAMSRLLLFRDDSLEAGSNCAAPIDSAHSSSSSITGGNCKARVTADPNLGGTGAMQSPLLFAVVRGQAEIAGLLLRAGASCNT